MKVKAEDLSRYQRDFLLLIHHESEKEGVLKINDSHEKLIPNLRSKKNYTLHYRNLKLYLSLGMRLQKIHRILKFKQSPWLKHYIDFNTVQRTAARNDFEKDFFKLMNNSMFGKTMENLRNRRKIDITGGDVSFRKMVAQSTFKSFTIFHEHLVAVERLQSELTLNRPIYTGLCVLDLSKILMYNFHYNYVKQKYPREKSKLLFTDTDSLVYKIQTRDLYHDMKEDEHLFDFSGYPNDHFCYSNANKKVIGKMKDELNGKCMVEFVGLRAKMYSVKYKSTSNEFQTMKKAKGVKKYVVKKHIDHEDYKKALFECKRYMHRMNSIRSEKHRVYTVGQNKSTLFSYDDKRYILSDGITTLAYGHYKINNNI